MLRRLILAALLCAPAAMAADVRVTPVRVNLSNEAPIASMHIENAGPDELLMQLRVVNWSQRNNEDVFEPTADVISNPPVFRLPAGGDQIVRFGLQTAAGADEKTYRVFIDQVPRAEDARANQVQTVLRISVPVFIPGAGAAAKIRWSISETGGRLTLLAANSGNAHLEVHRFVVRDGHRNEIAKTERPAYILAGQTHSWPLPNAGALHAGERVSVQAETDQQPILETLTVAGGTNAASAP